MSRFNPLDHPVCLSFPARLAPSAWIGHIPFAMFLVDLLRPRVFVELGTHYGVSYCAFCQAAKELGTETRCYAVDTWRGDLQAGFFGDEVLRELREHHDPAYSGFSRLLQATFDDASTQFANGSVDLLHIDGLHTYEAVRRDFETWLPKMSVSGVVLFHDTSVRDDDFGVWRLWDELKLRYPHWEMSHGHGLGLAVVGPERPPGLATLLDAPESALCVLREFFHQLGARLELAHALEEGKRTAARRRELEQLHAERVRREHPLFNRASRFFQLCAERGLRAGLRCSLAKIRLTADPAVRQPPRTSSR